MGIHSQSFPGAVRRTSLFEIKLRSDFGNQPLYFSTVQPDEESAARVGRAMLDRHDGFDIAEIWQGMRMLREV